MRDLLDEILAFIGAESLTDEEFDSLELAGTPALTKESYTALREVLEARESVSNATARLEHYFLAAGVDLGTAAEDAPTPKSNIFIGTEL